jgi:hypothetical protein
MCRMHDERVDCPFKRQRKPLASRSPDFRAIFVADPRQCNTIQPLRGRRWDLRCAHDARLLGDSSGPRVVPKAKAAARQAVRLQPDLGEGYASLAHVRLHDWDWVDLESEFRQEWISIPDMPSHIIGTGNKS